MTFTPSNENERDLLDFADAINAGQSVQARSELEKTYLQVQRAMQSESATMPPRVKQQSWEDVMNTLSLAPERPVSNRTRKQQSPPVHVHPPTGRNHGWMPLASIAAAALILLASFGIWRSIDTGSAIPPGSRQVAGLAPTNLAPMALATPETGSVQTTNRSIPIVQPIDEQPMDGPVIWLTTNGEVMYDDGLAVTTLATNASQVTPVGANVVQIIIDDPDKDITTKDDHTYDGYAVIYHNLLSGEELTDDGTFSSYLGGPNTFGSLRIGTIADAPNEWSIVNFDTMQSVAISSLTGGQFPSQESISVAVSDDLSTIAIAASQQESEASAIVMRQSGLPGDVAVIPASLDSVQWVSVPEGLPAIGNILLSPDGSQMVFISADNGRDSSTMTASAVEIASGDELVRTDTIVSTRPNNFQWVNNGASFVMVSNEQMIRYELDGSEPTIVFEAEGDMMLMPTFGDSNLLHLAINMGQPDTTARQFVILNALTGKAITVAGAPQDLGGSHPVTISESLSPILVSTDGETTFLVHPITGEIYPDVQADLEYSGLSDGEGQRFIIDLVTPASAAPISVVRLSVDTVAVVHTDESSMDIRVIDLPAEATTLPLWLSPDGSYLKAGSYWAQVNETQYVLDLTNLDADWTQRALGSDVSFVDIRDN